MYGLMEECFGGWELDELREEVNTYIIAELSVHMDKEKEKS